MMTPDIFRGKHVIVQGITGKHGSFHTERMLASGTQIVGGTSPNQSVTAVHGVPDDSRNSGAAACRYFRHFCASSLCQSSDYGSN